MVEAALIAGTLISAVGAISSAQGASAQAKYQATLADQNAQLARQNAAENERRQRVQSRKALGALRANIGAAGVTLEGSPMDVLRESAATTELDALTIRHEGELRARDYEASAALSRAEARNQKIGGYFSATGTLLGGAAKVGGYRAGAAPTRTEED